MILSYSKIVATVSLLFFLLQLHQCPILSMGNPIFTPTRPHGLNNQHFEKHIGLLFYSISLGCFPFCSSAPPFPPLFTALKIAVLVICLTIVDPKKTSKNIGIRNSLVARISACQNSVQHAGDRSSILRCGVSFFFLSTLLRAEEPAGTIFDHNTTLENTF